MYSLSDPEVRAFLLAGTRTGMLSYCAADGRPLVAPVWFVVQGDRLVFNTGRDTAKGRALDRDPRVAICVDLPRPPYAFVQVQGVAELSQEPADLLATATAIGARYMGEERAAEFGRRNAVPGELVVRVRPVRVIANFDVVGLEPAAGLSDLFDPVPTQWGARGDPWLWQALREHLAGRRIPPSADELIGLLLEAFRELVGVDLATEPASAVYREEYAHGGMTSGTISLDAWRERLLPLLAARASALLPG